MDRVLDMVMARSISTAFFEDFHEELMDKVVEYWIEYNYEIQIGNKKESNETFIWLDSDVDNTSI